MGFFDTSKSTNNNTTQNYDNRSVVTNTNTSYDLSDHSVTNIMDGGAVQGIIGIAKEAIMGAGAQTLQGYQYADSVFDAAMMFANETGKRSADAFAQAASLQRDTLTSATKAYSEANKSVATAYDRSTDAIIKATTSAQAAASQAQQATAAAYADAKGTTDSQKQIIIGVLVVAGLLAMASMKG